MPEADRDDGDGGYEVGDARVVAAAHFGGGAEAGADRRTKREVMAEVMAVSKAARAEKRMRTEEDEDLRDAVDERFAALLQVRHSMRSTRSSLVASSACPAQHSRRICGRKGAAFCMGAGGEREGATSCRFARPA